MSELRDPDLRYFAERLIHTKEGAAFMNRWRELKHLRQTIPTRKGEAQEVLRRRMIILDNQCAQALAELERVYGWPKP